MVYSTTYVHVHYTIHGSRVELRLGLEPAKVPLSVPCLKGVDNPLVECLYLGGTVGGDENQPHVRDGDHLCGSKIQKVTSSSGLSDQTSVNMSTIVRIEQHDRRNA